MEKIVDEVLMLDPENMLKDVYLNIQQSHYPVMDYSKLEPKLAQLLKVSNGKSKNTIQTAMQENAFNHVFINKSQLGSIAYRYYLSPEPQKMHAMVYALLNEFLERQLAVHFKYQLQSKAETCDRIVVYSDFNHRGEVEKALASVHQKYPQLFEGSERSLSWIYQSKISNVYVAPEKSGTSYGKQFAEILIRTRNIVNYLYNNVDENREIKFGNKQIERYVREEIKAIVVALMLKEGMILKKDDSFIQIIAGDSPDWNLNMTYNSSGQLYQTYQDAKYWYEIKYGNSIAAREYLRKMLYGIGHPDINKSIPEVKMRRLTIQEKKEELNRQLYPYLYLSNPTSGNSKVYCKTNPKKDKKPNQ